MADRFGTDLDDVLAGGDGPDRLFGLLGNDQLIGSGGRDQLHGGQGDDLYDLEDVNPLFFSGQLVGYYHDSIIELAGEGHDTVRVRPIEDQPVLAAVFSFTLPDEVEDGTILNSFFLNEPALAFDLTGNALGNRLSGNFAANILAGEGGNDILWGSRGFDELAGGAGNDEYRLDDLTALRLNGQVVGYAYDAVTELGGGGTDTVLVRSLNNRLILLAPDGYELGAHVENGRVTGTRAFDLTGNELANGLTGNVSDNTLSGAGGADRLAGGFGFDTLAGGAGDDVYRLDDITTLEINMVLVHRYDIVEEAAGGGTDLVIVNSLADATQVFGVDSYALRANVENARLTGNAAFDLTGNPSANELTGNDAANQLRGGARDDVLRGAGGNDDLFGGTGNDIVAGGAGADGFRFDTPLNRTFNVDRIIDFAPADDTIFVDGAVFAAFTAGGILAPAAFRIGTAAADATDRIIFNPATGEIFYDRDGAGAAAQILFAQVDAGTALTSADFAIYGG